MEIKPYKSGDEKSILTLFNLAFGKVMSEEYWTWRFTQNPFLKKLYIYLMWDRDMLVGHYAVSPVNMIVNGRVEKTALSMTTMTHPLYTGKGIFSQLAKSLYEKLEADDFNMVWGFPNNNSHYGFNKNLLWKDIGLQGMMSLDAVNFSKFKDNHNNCAILKNVEELEHSVILLLNTSEKYVRIDKTKEYLQWRYFSNPTAKYKILISQDKRGIIIYKVIPSFSDALKFEIDIMDIAFNNDVSLLLELLSSVLNTESDISKLNIWDSLFSPNQPALEKLGFRICSPVTYLGYKPLSSSDDKLADYRNWDISFSYSDVF